MRTDIYAANSSPKLDIQALKRFGRWWEHRLAIHKQKQPKQPGPRFKAA